MHQDLVIGDLTQESCFCERASTTGGTSRGTCKASDHGRAEWHHRGTWASQSASYSVYTHLIHLFLLV